jgi:hypothetical protein
MSGLFGRKKTPNRIPGTYYDAQEWTETTEVGDFNRRFKRNGDGQVSIMATHCSKKEWAAWMGANIGGTDCYMPVESGMPTMRDYFGGSDPFDRTTRCRYCGARSIPHTAAGRALMCPACGAPM